MELIFLCLGGVIGFATSSLLKPRLVGRLCVAYSDDSSNPYLWLELDGGKYMLAEGEKIMLEVAFAENAEHIMEANQKGEQK